MPFKYYQSHRRHIKKAIPSVNDWSSYNESLKQRGNLTIWLSPDAIDAWLVKDRIYDGTGTTHL